MAEGAALARGITLGEQQRERELDINKIIGSLPGYAGLQKGRPRASPAQIRTRAADHVLRERELNLAQRQIELQERDQALREQQYEDARAIQRGLLGKEEVQAARARRETAEEKAYGHTMRGIEAGQAAAEQGRVDKARAQKNDYDQAKVALATKNPAPIIDYFRKWGSAQAAIEDVQFAPDGRIGVKFQGADQPAIFEDSEQAFKMLLAPTNPDYAGATAQIEQQRKAIETGLKVSKEERERAKQMSLSPKQIAEYRKDAIAQYQKDYGDKVGGGFVEGAPDREQYIRDYIRDVTGIDTGSPARQPGGQTANRTRILRNKRTGEIVKIYPDGRYERITKSETGGAKHTMPVPKRPEKEKEKRGLQTSFFE